ncbi:MAG: hypothetical protein JF590_03445 [Gemmatimonadetes bacterium]|nr:hypothetical protein [Gemmatimonadota bacterium]
MNRIPTLSTIVGPVAALALVATAPAAAQSLWPRPLTSASELDLEWVRPTFPNESGLDGGRGVWILSGRTKVGERGRIVVAVPYLRAAGSGTGTGSGATFGDPYLGYESTDSTGKSTFVVGVRLPMAGTSESFSEEVAFLGDYDRFEESFPKTLTLHAEGQGEVWRDAEGADVRIRGGTTLLHSTEGSYSAQANSFTFDYGVRFGRPLGPLDLGLALTGRMLLSGSGGNIAQRSTHQATFELAGHGRIAPRIGVRVPVDEPLKSSFDRAIMIGVRVQLE